MDRDGKSNDQHHASVRTDGTESIKLVLSADRRERGEPESDAIDRRAVNADALLRDSQDDRVAEEERARGQSQTREAADADDGAGSNLSETTSQPAGARSSDLSIFIAWNQCYASRSGLEHRYYLHPPEARLRVFSSDPGLVQPIRVELGGFEYAACGVLRVGVGVGAEGGPARDLQQRSGRAIHECGVHRSARESRNPDQHGWTRSSAGQHLYRTALAIGEVRRGLHQGLRIGRSGDSRFEPLLRILQPRAAASVTWIQDAGVGLSEPGLIERLSESRGIRIASAAAAVKELRPLRGRSLRSRSLTAVLAQAGRLGRTSWRLSLFQGQRPPYSCRFSVQRMGYTSHSGPP